MQIRIIINRKKKNSTRSAINSRILGNHYSSVARKLNDKLHFSQHGTPAAEDKLLNNTNINFDFKHVSQNEVYETLIKLDSTKGPGPGELHPKIIKEIALPISSHLSNIFNKCIDKGVYLGHDISEGYHHMTKSYEEIAFFQFVE